MIRSLVAMLALLAAAATAQAQSTWRDVDVTAQSVTFYLLGSDDAAAGRLVFRGGLDLASSDGDFGGISAFRLTDDGAGFLGVIDQGRFVRGRLTYEDGRLTGAETIQIRDMTGLNGDPLKSRLSDSESLVIDDDAVLVGFERRHRIWRFMTLPNGAFTSPTPYTFPAGVTAASSNGGLESLVRMNDGRLVALTESLREANDDLVGWVLEDGDWNALGVATQEPFALTDAATGPDGDLFLIERHWSPATGVRINIRRVPQADVLAGARLEGTLIAELDNDYRLDNFEGLDLRRDDQGRTLLYVISDDNFNVLQRTYLMMFEVLE